MANAELRKVVDAGDFGPLWSKEKDIADVDAIGNMIYRIADRYGIGVDKVDGMRMLVRNEFRVEARDSAGRAEKFLERHGTEAQIGFDNGRKLIMRGQVSAGRNEIAKILYNLTFMRTRVRANPGGDEWANLFGFARSLGESGVEERLADNLLRAPEAGTSGISQDMRWNYYWNILETQTLRGLVEKWVARGGSTDVAADYLLKGGFYAEAFENYRNWLIKNQDAGINPEGFVLLLLKIMAAMEGIGGISVDVRAKVSV